MKTMKVKRPKTSQAIPLDIHAIADTKNTIAYNDEELVVIADLRQIPDAKARKLGVNVVAACVAGQVEMDVTGETRVLKAGQVLICQSRAVLSHIKASPDLECRVMLISDRLMRNILQTQMLMWSKMLCGRRCRIVNVPIERLALYEELRSQWLHKDSPFKRDILVCMLRAACLQLLEDLAKCDNLNFGSPDEGNMRMEQIFQQFLENIAQRRIKKISVAEYAQDMCITPKYLSTVCRMVSDKSPMEWISEYVMEDVIHYLTHTTLAIKEIGNELGFANSSFFGKYVREHLGMTPYEYRRKQRMATIAKVKLA